MLRAVSHDLRSPLTAIVDVGARRSPRRRSTSDERTRARRGRDARRAPGSARLIDKLLELSRLQAGAAEPRRDWCSVEELLREAVDVAGAGRRTGSSSRSTATCR